MPIVEVIDISGISANEVVAVMEISVPMVTTSFVNMQENNELSQIKGAIHFAGIGGIGMSALARILLSRGFKVSGSDKQKSAITEELEDLGAQVNIGHDASHMLDAGALVISTAIVEGNPELAQARARNLPVYHRSDILNMLAVGQKLISVTGTHGKTTTTAMVGQVLMGADFDPSIVVGGVFDFIGANSRSGSDYFVAESDESDGTHVKASSYASIITNIEADHLENYPGGFDEILASMVKFVQNTSEFCVVCTDDRGVRSLLSMLPEGGPRIVTYGKEPGGDYRFESNGLEMRVYKGQKALGTVAMRVPGDHNKCNILAALVTALELGADFDKAAKAASDFGGVDRRFQKIGEVNGILVVDDYAHHPTEVAALLKAAREYRTAHRGGKGRIVCVFQPHQPGRLRDLWQEFRHCFDGADLALIADIYIARGGKIAGIDSETFVKEVTCKDARYISGGIPQIAETLSELLAKDDLVLTVGAGDITTLGPILLERLQKS